MDATTIHLANGLARTVRGRAEDVGAAMKRRTLGDDDGLRSFIDLDGDTVTVNIGAVVLTESAEEITDRTFGFAQALEAA